MCHEKLDLYNYDLFQNDREKSAFRFYVSLNSQHHILQSKYTQEYSKDIPLNQYYTVSAPNCNSNKIKQTYRHPNKSKENP